MPITAPTAASESGAWPLASDSSAPRADRKIAGVCAGVAEYFDLDVTLVRVVWLITAVMTGIGLLSYPVAWIIMPEEPARAEVPAGYQATHQ